MSTVATSAIRMIHTVDPKQAIMKDAKGFLDSVVIVNPFEVILIAYERLRGSQEQKTTGGIIIPQTAERGAEDKFQGSIALVVKMGELAFTESDDHKWGKRTPKVGDWVTYRINDTHPLVIRDMMIRQIVDTNIKLIFDGDPSEVV